MMSINPRRLQRVVNITGFPALQIGAEISSPDEDDGQLYMGVSPVSIDIWEFLGGGIVPDSDLTEYWGWFLYYPGIDLSQCDAKNYPTGVIEVSSNGLIGLVDGGKKVSVDNADLQDAVMEIIKELLSESVANEKG